MLELRNNRVKPNVEISVLENLLSEEKEKFRDRKSTRLNSSH